MHSGAKGSWLRTVRANSGHNGVGDAFAAAARKRKHRGEHGANLLFEILAEQEARAMQAGFYRLRT